MKVLVCLEGPQPGRASTTALALALALPAEAEITVLTAAADDASAWHPAPVPAGVARLVRLIDPALGQGDFLTLGLAMAMAARRIGAQLVLTGARTDDEGLGAVPAALARHLDAPLLTRVDSVDGATADSPCATIRGGGLVRVMKIRLPAVLSVAALALIPTTPPPARAGTATVETWSLADLGLDPAVIFRRGDGLGVFRPAAGKTAVISSAAELLRLAGL
jgi:electron transfer flavoprotein beta subunit